ncbi:hypothetical protein [Staphylococcus capitis]|uniref:Uncharacterized protein n=1 Tax=Staphylococcus capitis TaxID=29388 RepID=A0ABX1SSF3_STACP|nr:hypothetical protein [Staphylococcus capitis]NMK53999.1 hypothetical protein [Staphylococcus capitis]NMK69308.1 hypothetical protein [Staphylococcus capitis]
MKYTQDHPIWAVIKNAYTHNDQPILFTLYNIFLIIAIAIAIYGIVKWIKEGKEYRLLTITASILSIVLILFAIIYLSKSDNKVGNYKGTVDIAFTSSVKGTDKTVAQFSKKAEQQSSDGISSIVMNTNDAKKLGIKAGKTIKVDSKNKPAPNEDKTYVTLDKDDVKKVTDSKNITDFNKSQKEKEEKKAKEKKKKEAKKKAKKKKKK